MANPIDLALKHVTPVLTAHGFVKRGRSYHRVRGRVFALVDIDAGPHVEADVRPFWVSHGVGVAAWNDYVYGDGQDLATARSLAPFLKEPLKPTPGLASKFGEWELTKDNVDEVGAALVTLLQDRSVPLLIRLMDPVEALAEVRKRELSMVTDAGSAQTQEILLRIDDAPPEEILTLLESVKHSDFKARFGPWVHDRLARRAAREA